MADTSLMLFSCAMSTKLKPTSATAAMRVPTTMKGVRRPFLLWLRSEMAPNRGSRNSASTLSSAMMTPDHVWDMPNLLVRIRGMVLSYACQKAQIRKKAKPTRMVRL